jgi:carbonic anhydrase
MKRDPNTMERLLARLSLLPVAGLATLSCAAPAETHEATSSAERPAQHEAVLATEGNIAVRAHAPDAESEYELGYILPSRSTGLRQSPIDIMTKDVEIGRHSVVPHYGPSHEHIHNLGHTIQVDYDSGSYIEFEGEVYDLVQFHFHTPSEHRIDGMTFPMEVHLVHKRREPEGSVPHYLVIGALYKCGEKNRFLQQFIDTVPTQEHTDVELADTMIHVNEVLEEELNHFYHYTGSLTTPPFTETVDWMVLERIFEASPEQIALINRIEGNNARHVHALDGRTVDRQQVDG